MTPAQLTFEDSGKGSEVLGRLTLAAVQQLCVECGFEKKAAGADKPLSQRADMESFFKVVGVNALSQFKTKFAGTKLDPPTLAQLDAVLAAEKEPKKKKPPPAAGSAAARSAAAASSAPSAPVPSISEFKALALSFEGLKWKMIPRPGGASTKPEDFYTLFGSKMQAEEGDNNAEKPMWAETGGLDFDGRERWEAWGRHKGLTSEEAKGAFCAAYARAMSRETENFRKY